MHPAKAAIINTALAPLWQRLRSWMSAALHNHEHSRDKLTREELAPIRTAIFEIEALLRRLVLVAATTLTLNITARWSPPPKTDDKTRAKQSTKRIVRAAKGFRLYTIAWSKSDPSTHTTVVLPRAGEEPQASCIHTHETGGGPPSRSNTGQRTTAYSDTLTSGPSTCRSSQGAGRPHAHPRAHISKEPPEMTPEDFLRWCATSDHAAAAAAATAAFNEEYRKATQDPDTRPRCAPTHPARPKLEHKTVPDQLDATALQAHLALLKELVANPEKLIRRAALAMARRRETAYRLSLIKAPKAIGHLAVSAVMAGVIIPFHYDFSEALLYFAISHTEPDTT